MPASSSIAYTPRISDSDTMTNKLIYQVRQNQLSPAEMDRLQNRSARELHALRRELNELLNELRAIAERGAPVRQDVPRRTAA
ncbi:hypothetical protein [Paenibacillus sacheonensis]|uniref:Uncharacterized protein n=1 Tax=Paenibacillus sacheonensis TaxID=742054 RepID=A0A7X4YSN5_9BACL|nr:hypothetical protein [Paenibacillus sacheonensis]MBM7567178.1 hypothetical protein [Paenibacillus sacheonensis]NBC70896.1 hypothetical protein [Paenibacillus sacheonensis]